MDLSRLYHLLFSQYGPGLTGIFMRQRHAGNVKAAPLKQATQPATLGVLLVTQTAHCRARTINQ